MVLRKKMLLVSLVLCFAVAGCVGDVSAQSVQGASIDLNLSPEQLVALQDVIKELNDRQFQIVSSLQKKGTELELELKRADRFDTEAISAESSRKVRKLVREISALFGELLRTRVEYALEAKNVFTPEQKDRLINSLLEFEFVEPEVLPYGGRVEVIFVQLDLTEDQMRKVLTYRRDAEIKELKLEAEIDFKTIELQSELAADARDFKKINELILEITDLEIKVMDNKVDFFLKFKGVLTAAQKKKLLHVMMANP
jgi:Spy/CpxP family protein refolding chaperone